MGCGCSNRPEIREVVLDLEVFVPLLPGAVILHGCITVLIVGKGSDLIEHFAHDILHLKRNHGDCVTRNDTGIILLRDDPFHLNHLVSVETLLAQQLSRAVVGEDLTHLIGLGVASDLADVVVVLKHPLVGVGDHPFSGILLGELTLKDPLQSGSIHEVDDSGNLSDGVEDTGQHCLLRLFTENHQIRAVGIPDRLGEQTGLEALSVDR